HRDARGGWRFGALSTVRSFDGGDRRDPLCRFRLPHRRGTCAGGAEELGRAARLGRDELERSHSSDSNSLFCRMILPEKSAPFREHAPEAAREATGELIPSISLKYTASAETLLNGVRST